MPVEKLASPKVKKEVSYLLQFLPENLEPLSKVELFEFKGKKLKSAYIVDLVHSLLLKFFFKKDNNFTLSSLVLKANYGKFYNYYIDFLLENEVIYLVKNYSVGTKSRQFQLSKNIIDKKITRYKNNDKVILKKREKKLNFNENNKINAVLKLKLIENLSSATLDYEKSIFFINSIVSDKDTYNRNLYSIDCINNKFIFWHFDDYGRFHTNFTILKSFIRKNCLMLDDKEVSEVDIANSQPLFLLKIIESNSSKCKASELEQFRSLVLDGQIYDYLRESIPHLTRDDIKPMVYHVLFGPNKRSKADSLFKKHFPSIYNFIIEFKKEKGDYRQLSYELQRAESEFIYNRVLIDFSSKFPEVPFLTVHDSIIVPKDFVQECKMIFDKHFNDYFRG